MTDELAIEQGMPDTEPEEWLLRWTQEYLSILLNTGFERQRALEHALDYATRSVNTSYAARERMIAAKAVYQAVINLRKAGYDV